ncbi:MAG: glycosyltransferase [Chloroflexi bacterium]|nr:glycosyltransferase [Chloroflexota bacterium]
MIKFSVIIPTRNRPEALANCLESFAMLDYPTDCWELIVVNDGGEESFTAVTNQMCQLLPLRLVEIPPSGPAAARNKGVALAQYDYLAFTDDDCCVESDWLQQFAQTFEKENVDGVGGRAKNPQPEERGMQTAQFLVDFLYDYMRDEQGNALLLITNNAAYRRTAFEKAGGFDESYRIAAAEDLEFSHRMVRLGYRQVYCPIACVWHCHKLNNRGHIRQQFRYGRGGYYFYAGQSHLDNESDVPHSATSFYLELGRQLYHSSLSWRTRSLVIIAQIAYRVGIFFERIYRCLVMLKKS